MNGKICTGVFCFRIAIVRDGYREEQFLNTGSKFSAEVIAYAIWGEGNVVSVEKV